MNRQSTNGFFAGLILGAVIGAAVGLLYAPQSGPETRLLVKEKASKAVSKLKESASSLIKAEG